MSFKTSSPEGRQEAAVLDAPVAVRELEWVDCTMADEEGEPIFEGLDLRAQSGIGNYYVSYDHFTDRAAPIALSTPTNSRTGFATEDQAKAAAQVHFEAAIRSALIPAKPAMEVVEALKDAEDTLRLVERPAFRDPHYGDEVEALGLRIGFGALMSSASASWRDYLAARGMPVGAEYVAGPCHGTVIATLAKIRAALSQAPATHDAQTEVEK